MSERGKAEVCSVKQNDRRQEGTLGPAPSRLVSFYSALKVRNMVNPLKYTDVKADARKSRGVHSCVSYLLKVLIK